MADRPVYYGHWSETPDYSEKLGEWLAFINEDTPDPVRASILAATRAKYYVSVDSSTLPPQSFCEEYLIRVFEEGAVTVFRVKGRLPVYAMRL